MIDQTEIKK